MAPGPEGDISVADFVGNMLGDVLPPAEVSAEHEGDDTPEAAAGAPPAEHADPEQPDGPEGTDPDEHAGAPPVDAAATAPDDAAPDPDPLASAVPLAYVVNGESRTYEGIKVLGEHGAIIDAKDLPDVMRRLGERDHLFEQSKQRYEEHQALERRTAWNVSDGQGNTRTLTGAPALEAQRVALARTLATNAVMSAALNDPEQFQQLVSPVQDADGNWYVVPNKQALAHLTRDAELAAIRAEGTVRTHFAALGAPPAPVEASAAEIALPTIELTAKSLNVTGLTDEDKQFLAEQFPHYVRAATAEEIRNGSQPRVLDASFGTLMQRTASANTAKATAVTAASDIAKANAAKLAAARIGKPQQHAPRIPSKPKAPVLPPRAQSDSDAWDQQENALHAGLVAKSLR